MTQAQDLTYADIAKRARSEASSFAEAVIGERPTYKSGSEIRFLENQSLVVYVNGNRQGTWRSFSDEGARGDMLDLCQYVKGMNKYESLLYAKDLLGITKDSIESPKSILPIKSPEEQAREDAELTQKKLRTAKWIWNNASPTDGKEDGERYLKEARGLSGPFDPALVRFRTLSKEDLLKMGAASDSIPATPVVAVVFKATNASGELCAVQQILTTQGKKITAISPDFENPKRTNGLLTGSAVKFGGEQPERVILAEGPETALSLWEATGIPTWITLGTSNYTTLELPKSVKEVIIAADMEPSGVGLGAALRAAQHWTRAGVPKVGIALPRTENGDFNDILKSVGPKALKSMVDTAFYGEKPRALDSVLITADSRAAFHVWQKTGIETRVRVPGKNKDGERFPISLDSMVEPHHTHVLLIERKGFSIVSEHLAKDRPDVVVTTLSEDSTKFLNQAKKPGFVEKLVSDAVDVYAPNGKGTKEPLAFCLRRKDAETLISAGHNAVAVRATALDQVDLSFIKNRKAYICPVGTGVKEDRKLEETLNQAGAETTRLVWQLFRPEGDGFRLVRKDIPKTYGAAEAVNEGWKGEKMAQLLRISQVSEQQLRTPVEETLEKAPSKKQETR